MIINLINLLIVDTCINVFTHNVIQTFYDPCKERERMIKEYVYIWNKYYFSMTSKVVTYDELLKLFRYRSNQQIRDGLDMLKRLIA